MMQKILPFFLFFTLIFNPFVAGAAFLNKGSISKKRDSGDTWVVSYYVGYQNGYLKPKDVDYTLMTHIVVGGVGVNSDGTLREHWHMENGDGHDVAVDIGKRAHKKGVKTLIWLGGPNEEDFFYSATSDENREEFVENILELVDDLGYDGVDIDWEPIRTKDEARILDLVKDLRKAEPDLIITVPVNWVTSTLVGSKDLSVYKKMSSYVDKMFIMSYSMAGAWPGWSSWHGSALYGESSKTPSSIDSSVTAYLEADVPNEKLGIGVGTYATCWKYPIKKAGQTIPTTLAGKGTSVMSMRTMMEDYYKRSYEKWDSRAKVPYLSFKKKQGDFECGYISYENTRSVKEKVAYVKDTDLGGVLVWNIGTGYFPEKSASRRNPLLKAIWESLK